MWTRMKGINRVRKRLADGRSVVYYYAWKGGPPLPGKPGSAEFRDAYNDAIASKRQKRDGALLSILNAYQRSPDFLDRAERTRHDYIGKIKLIEKRFKDFP